MEEKNSMLFNIIMSVLGFSFVLSPIVDQLNNWPKIFAVGMSMLVIILFIVKLISSEDGLSLPLTIGNLVLLFGLYHSVGHQYLKYASTAFGILILFGLIADSIDTYEDDEEEKDLDESDDVFKEAQIEYRKVFKDIIILEKGIMDNTKYVAIKYIDHIMPLGECDNYFDAMNLVMDYLSELREKENDIVVYWPVK